MKRSGPIARRAPMSRSSSKLSRAVVRQWGRDTRKLPKRAERTDRAFTAFVHRQPCCVSLCLRTNIEQHHKREGAGIALRGHDRDSISLCREHHAALHGLTEPFKGWNREQLRGFVNDHIARLNALYDEGAA